MGLVISTAIIGNDLTYSGIYGYWQSIASSADGTRLAAAVQDGQIYTSTIIFTSVSGEAYDSLELRRSPTTPVVTFQATDVDGPLTVTTL